MCLDSYHLYNILVRHEYNYKQTRFQFLVRKQYMFFDNLHHTRSMHQHKDNLHQNKFHKIGH